MAIDARCHGMVAGLLPRIILGLHDVAICACGGIRTEVRKPFRVLKREARYAHLYAEHNEEHGGQTNRQVPTGARGGGMLRLGLLCD